VLPKRDRKAYIFRIFKFFIGTNKMNPLKTGIERYVERVCSKVVFAFLTK
jgi:hypothetical protein